MTVYDFDAGLPDPACYPVDHLRALFDETLRADGRSTLDYADGASATDMVYGHHGLRSTVARWLGEHEGAAVAEDGVLLANGSMNGLSMAVRALVGPGDAVVVESVSYPYVRQFAETAGARVLSVPVDEEGMVVEELPRRLDEAEAAGLRPRLVYTVATFHSPTGTVLSTERRRRLVDLAAERGVIVLDDNCYYHLHYDGPPAPSLLAVAEGGPVVQSASFSKYVAPGLRMAWLAGPEESIATIAAARQDFAVSQLTARVLEAYIERGLFDDHLAELRRIYRRKRDVAAAALERHCAPWVRFAVPAGGIYFWLEVDEQVDYDLALERAAAEGVRSRPGVRFVDERTGTRCLRLSVVRLSDPDIEAGIAALGRALRSTLEPSAFPR